MNRCYVYVVFRPDGRPLYVGKGTGSRWKRHDRKVKHNPHYGNVLALAGGDLPVVVVRENLTNDDAYQLEEALTRAIGIESDGGPLINIGYGGRGGPTGIKRSNEFKRTRSRRAIEAWQDPEVREKMLRPDRARSGNTQPRSPEFKSAMSERLRGNQHTLGLRHTDEAREKMSKAQAGRPKSPEHRQNIARALTGMKYSEARVDKVRQALTGRTLSEAKRTAISEGLRRRRDLGLPVGRPKKVS